MDTIIAKAIFVSVDIRNGTLMKVLETIFKDQPFTFEIFDKAIIVKLKPVIGHATQEKLPIHVSIMLILVVLFKALLRTERKKAVNMETDTKPAYKRKVRLLIRYADRILEDGILLFHTYLLCQAIS